MNSFTQKTLIFSIVFLTAIGAYAQNIVTLEAEQDNTIFGFFVNDSNGAGPEMYSGVINDNIFSLERRALIQFPIADNIPENVVITDAYIELFCTKASASGVDSDYSFHRLLESWGEGDSFSPNGQGVPASDGDATWVRRFVPDISWLVEGGNFNEIASASIPVNQNNLFYQWTGTQIIDDVQDMLDNPTENFGWILKAADESLVGTGRGFGSRQNPNINIRPKLVVSYEVIDAVDESLSASQWTVYPNPGNNTLNIKTPGLFLNETYKISDVQGRTVKEGFLTSESTLVDTEDIQKGYYFISFSNAEIQTIKWVKQ
jgi:hypothetical protein